MLRVVALMEDDSAKAPAAANANLTETTSTTDAAVGVDDDACAHVVHVVKPPAPPPAKQHPNVGLYHSVFKSLGWDEESKWRPLPSLGGSWGAIMKPTTNAFLKEVKASKKANKASKGGKKLHQTKGVKVKSKSKHEEG